MTPLETALALVATVRESATELADHAADAMDDELSAAVEDLRHAADRVGNRLAYFLREERAQEVA